MPRHGRSLFIQSGTRVERVGSAPTVLAQMELADTQPALDHEEPMREQIEVVPEPVPVILGNPPRPVAYLELPTVTPEIILNYYYLVTPFSLLFPSDPVLNGCEVLVYNNSIQSIIVRANNDCIFEICARETGRFAYLAVVGLWVRV